MKLNKRTLGDICDEVGGIIQTGPFGSQLHQKDYVDEGIPVVMPKNIIDGRISKSDIAMITESDAERLSRHRLQSGEIVYGRRGDIGRQALITEREAGWLCGTGCLRISLGKSVIDPVFLHYYLRQPDIVAWIANQAIGATMPNLNTTILRSVPVSYPDLPTQHKIASLLSSYDKLIENNSRRIQILEDIACLVYREWFVHHRFPGHEMNGADRSTPVGWTISTLGKACDIIMGQSPSSQFYNRDAEGLPFHQGVTNFGNHFPADEMYCTGEHRQGERLDILFSVRAPVGRINLAKGRLVLGRGLSAIRNKTGHQMFTLYQLKERFHEEDTIGGGTIFKAVTKDDMHSIPFLIPSDEILREYDSFASSIIAVIENLTTTNSSLRTTRDFLLPKLISGAVPIVDAEESSRELAEALA